ncbi:hypothetical protein GCM10009678_61280 [Actinomadura kijaniata]
MREPQSINADMLSTRDGRAFSHGVVTGRGGQDCGDGKPATAIPGRTGPALRGDPRSNGEMAALDLNRSWGCTLF